MLPDSAGKRKQSDVSSDSHDDDPPKYPIKYRVSGFDPNVRLPPRRPPRPRRLSEPFRNSADDLDTEGYPQTPSSSRKRTRSLHSNFEYDDGDDDIVDRFPTVPRRYTDAADDNNQLKPDYEYSGDGKLDRRRRRPSQDTRSSGSYNGDGFTGSERQGRRNHEYKGNELLDQPRRRQSYDRPSSVPYYVGDDVEDKQPQQLSRSFQRRASSSYGVRERQPAGTLLKAPSPSESRQPSSFQRQPCDCSCKNLYRYFPSRTATFELLCIFLDCLAIVFFALSLVYPWMHSVEPCKDCPYEASSVWWLEKKDLQLTFGLNHAGGMSNTEYIPVTEYFNYLNTNQSREWSAKYHDYFFPPGARIKWGDISSNLVCVAKTPGFSLWALPNKFCPYSTPSYVNGTKALLCIACIFSAFSLLMMIAARKGRVGFAQASSVCSLIAGLTALGALLWFIEWEYVRLRHDSSQSTIPLRALNPGVVVDGAVTLIVPISAKFTWDIGYYFTIIAICFEFFTTLVSWIVGTEKCWWRPDPEVVYGQESWVYGAPASSTLYTPRPTLDELASSTRYRESGDDLSDGYDNRLATI